MLSSVEQAFVGKDEIGAPLACVAGVRKGRGREVRAGERERGRRGGSFLFSLLRSRAQIPPSPFNACHTGYSSPKTPAWEAH